ncbi:DUF5928 domain-containing protein [Paracoccus sp. p4-l81]|uniref:DUF5928 domain-containing protein n=1 Tax=unclassified Paracoccus (in: a-proteobacteria) TaxID=2688777 RepID=UPI0035B8CD73
MARIAFILLTHKDPEGVIAQAERLTATGDYVSIHFDGRAKPADYQKLRDALHGNPGVVFAPRRHKCGWGEWSLVAATLEALRAAEAAFPRATHFYMLSGDCMPIKSAAYAHAFLDCHDVDYIESFDFFGSDWIKTGIKEERLIYRHWFNERNSKGLFYASMNLQRRLGLARKVPADLDIMIGSQWWCLRRPTVEKVLGFCAARPDVLRFFSTTWIPDETFFQTIVRHLIPAKELRTRTLTFLLFTDYGMPANFYNDHYQMLLAQDYLFARKISPDARQMKAQMADLWLEDRADFTISGEGPGLFRFLTQRGRIGRRFAPRFWEDAASVGRDRTLNVVVCKKWHVAKRLARKTHEVTGIPMLEYLFNEANAGLPDLGGVERSVGKRTRHRRALMRLLFDHYGTGRLGLCVDPSDMDLLRDFAGDRAETRILLIDVDFSDDYLRGHLKRVGLAADTTPPDVIDRLLPTLRNDLRFETERLSDAGFAQFARIRPGLAPEVNAHAIADFLEIGHAEAEAIARTPHLFDD